MAQKLLSISIGTSSAKLAEIAKSGKKVQIFSAYDIPISDGLCDDGVILDVDALADELKQYISKYRIKAKDLVFSIASKRIASKEVIIPFVKEKQIMSIVEINAPEYFPVANISDYSLNYSIIELLKSAENTQYRINVTATPSDVLKGYALLAEKMKRNIESIDYSGNAILQVLKAQTHAGEVNAILQLGYENTVINIMNGNVQIMQRSVSNGLSAIISTVCESVGLDEEDAVAFLEDNDISRITGAYPDVKYIVDSLITSIGRIFDFYNGRSSEHPITGVKFVGDATYVNGIGAALESGLGYPSEEIFTLNNVVAKGRQVTPEIATNFMSNIGAIIQPMNLRYVDPEDKDKAKDKEGKLPWGLVIISFIAAVALVGSSLALYFMSKTEMQTLQLQVDALAPMRQVEAELNEVMARSSAIAGYYESTKGANDNISMLISDLESLLPVGTSIDSLSIDNGMVSISGGGIGKRSIARLVEELKKKNYITDIKVDYISEQDDTMGVYDNFNLAFRIITVVEEESGMEEGTEDPENVIYLDETEGGI